ncbi:acetylornithine transaminase [Oceanobacillus caeni]|uniref:Acetylornithine aminotransferase n=1 Tax=Oceanobacillus caeni TaxID=405946 RepID=A0ABR5MNT7_9BACI|nr:MULTISPECIES: acetylornithine transaminase [Bacillaceae]KKE79136.1 acetylornithine aminotransferase [Bacilli bacterium VT-13-104]PZD87621.1 acetylornithine transaminase [Bacilli bacterium]KPH79243.1 acetylornithine aminotransferase [Oceanobacillus caeni]MBU8790424.1 acetylornithine transaminase [Oceanobacillus caeni]MCR1836116.1 acetylornithine transaminase [Oceanobacillus caeni]
MSNNLAVKNIAIMNTYNRFPVKLVKGKGSKVWDDKENEYLDYTSGIATCNLGHVPDQVQSRVKEQLDLLWHCSNLYEIPNQEELAELLTQNSVFEKVFFCNSGAEANEAAIKIAKKYAKDQGNPERTDIVTFKQSFHGRTGATMAATGQEKIHQGFTPLAVGFRYLALNDFESLSEISDGKTTAVLLEVIQGEGGVNPVDKEWLTQLEKICKENDILLMVDEVQTGMGRTGTLFAYEQFGVKPDVITLAKGLGSGIPIGAMLASESVAASFSPGTHGSTFGGNPLATSAGIATIESILSDGFLAEVKEKSDWFRKQLEKLRQSSNKVIGIKGLGFLVGIELTEPVGPWIDRFREKGILVLSAGANVLRVLPPLTTTKEELNQFVNVFHEIETEE